MIQLIVDLNKKNELISKETSSGRWAIYIERHGQRNRLEEKHFSSYEMESELEKAIKSLSEWKKRLE